MFVQTGTAGLLEGLLHLAQDKVHRAERIMEEYVGLLRSGAQEQAGSMASSLDSVRGEKRGVMRDIIKLMKHEGRQGQLDFVIFKV